MDFFGYKSIVTRENIASVQDGLDYLLNKGDYENMTTKKQKTLYKKRTNIWKAYFTKRYE